MASNLSPIQILMLGLAGYGGYRQGKQQRADELGEISRKDAQQKFENDYRAAILKLQQDEGARAQGRYEDEGIQLAFEKLREGQAAGANKQLTSAFMAPAATLADRMKNIQTALMGLSPEAPVNPGMMQQILEVQSRGPMISGTNTAFDPLTNRWMGAGAINGGMSAAYPPTRGGGPSAPKVTLRDYTALRTAARREYADELKYYDAVNRDEAGDLKPGAKPFKTFDEFFEQDYYPRAQLFAGLETVEPPPDPAQVGTGGAQFAQGALLGGMPRIDSAPGARQSYQSPTLAKLGQDPVVVLEPGETPAMAEDKIQRALYGAVAETGADSMPMSGALLR